MSFTFDEFSSCWKKKVGFISLKKKPHCKCLQKFITLIIISCIWIEFLKLPSGILPRTLPGNV